jgi:hypothetical protein
MAARATRKSWTRQLAKQTPCGYCYVVVRSDGAVTGPVLYRGENAAEHFFEAMQNELETINGVFRQPKDIVMTQEDKASFAEAADCHVCGGPLNGDRVRDHCHITGKYRGAAHNACNLKLRIYAHKTKVPVVFHNLRGYDGHLLMQAIGKADTKRPAWKKDKTGKWVQTEKTDAINCIPNNMEKYMTFGVGQLQFIDSLQFMNSRLDKLVANLQTENMVITAQSHTDTELALLRRKGVYPYEYVDSFERFDEARLPPKEAFYSHLKRKHISDDEIPARAARLGGVRLQDVRRLPRHLPPDRCAPPRRRIRNVPQHVDEALRPRPRALLHRARNVVGRASEKDAGEPRAPDRHRHAPVLREGPARRDLDGVPQAGQGQQPASRRPRPGETHQLDQIRRREQPLRLGDEPDAAGGRIRMGCQPTDRARSWPRRTMPPRATCSKSTSSTPSTSTTVTATTRWRRRR